jgi:hypothetical protein
MSRGSGRVGGGSRAAFLPGRDNDAIVPRPGPSGLSRRQNDLAGRVEVLEGADYAKVYRYTIGCSTLRAMAGSTAQESQFLLKLPLAGCILRAYAWTPEPFIASGTPRTGYNAMTALNVSVGTDADIDLLLVAKDVYSAGPTWYQAADKGVAFGADARLDAVLSFTDKTVVRAFLVPSPSDADFTLLTHGRLEIILVASEPVELI